MNNYKELFGYELAKNLFFIVESNGYSLGSLDRVISIIGYPWYVNNQGKDFKDHFLSVFMEINNQNQEERIQYCVMRFGVKYAKLIVIIANELKDYKND